MSKNEDEHFAREELHRKQKESIEKVKQALRERQKLHHMKCPKCGDDLETKIHEEVEIDVCKGCSGVWLDPGELETLAGKESTGLKNFFGLFKDE